MTIDKLKRLIWRFRETEHDLNNFPWFEIKKAIYIECGTDPKTLRHNVRAMQDLGMIKRINKWRWRIEDTDW